MMRSPGATLHCSGWRRYAIAVVLAITTAVVLNTYFDISSIVPWRPRLPTLQTFPVAPLTGACDGIPPPKSDAHDDAADAAADAAAAPIPIPNLVHYVWLLADPSVLSFDFKVFVSVYSAHLYFRPDRIYFHTDAAPDLWERAKTSGDPWTRRVLNIPGVTPNFVENPRSTSGGVEIDTFGAKSDFLRADALRRHGGIYLDVDAVPLRDVAPLRRAGFANVVGGAVALRTKHAGFVNTGVWLARPHSTLAEVFFRAMDAFYNGVWAVSVDILTDLAYRLHAIPGEVLIVHPRAFAPTSWELEDQERLFRPHGWSAGQRSLSAAGDGGDDDGSAGVRLPGKEGLGNTCADALAWLAKREERSDGAGPEGWEMDFSSTYVLHAFDDYADQVRGWDGKITLKYVLARQSNYARAVYPAIWHALEAGIIPKEETQ
ncbi:hypothetical protein MYCTH_2307527 [Thermothelomyces thermophilus ATCC 42464]|uniref:Glycosyltransferase family 32 protein n=1 Tax=Thermothelomyces thermophilus (strain ATCC 42464 / BCRC 31852 / DSM 1799) TaxID=573729 RepID=G2QG08_THET4|nr:uncharacterized protein MYCTH_2307527 [Thermothelomyces thermophilus ATCC 42464]AEO59321.1 hypothetical protein MYCTH_2307527 [Thermothelomyces thermophilus ATCC 42464]